MALNTPVVFLIFNRPYLTERVFQAIAQAQPRQLLVVADGSRNAAEAELCQQARDVIQQVNWDCEVLTNFAAENLGCKRRVASGLDWVFSQVEEAIILEDDCLPAPSFFTFCQVLLERYREDERIFSISGNNFQTRTCTDYSYYFSRYAHIWGWASWRRAWQYYDVTMSSWPEYKKLGLLQSIFEDPTEQDYWTTLFERSYQNLIDTWDHAWGYTCCSQNGLTILPAVNLVSNLGFGEAATHTTDSTSSLANLPTGNIWEIHHPKLIARHAEADAFTANAIFGIKYLREQKDEQINNLQERLVQSEAQHQQLQLLLEQHQQLQFELDQTKTQRDELQTQIQQLRQQKRKQKQQLTQQLQETQAIIAAMETSKFWKLRSAWLGMKSKLWQILASKPLLAQEQTQIVNSAPMAISPLAQTDQVTLLETLKSQDVIVAWQTSLQIDIASELEPHEQFYLYQCNQTKLKFFRPESITGSEYLYQQLEKFDWYYMTDKWEYDMALKDLLGCQKVLEIGAGRGSFIARLQAQNIDALGIELNSKAVATAQRQNIPVVQRDLAELIVEQPNQFDGVCAFQVLEHLPDPKAFLVDALKLLKPNGKLILSVPNADAFPKYIGAAHLLDYPPHHMSQWSAQTFASLTTLLPIKLEQVRREPLADYHVDFYVSVLKSELSRSAWAKYPLIEPKLHRAIDWLETILKRYAVARRLIKGHTLYVCFTKQ